MALGWAWMIVGSKKISKPEKCLTRSPASSARFDGHEMTSGYTWIIPRKKCKTGEYLVCSRSVIYSSGAGYKNNTSIFVDDEYCRHRNWLFRRTKYDSVI